MNKHHWVYPTSLVATVMSLAVLAGCASSGGSRRDNEAIMSAGNAFAAGRPSLLAPYYKALYVEGEWNSVLNFQQLGLAAMQFGDYETAEKSFDAAITRIEAIYANDPNAQRAKKKFTEEKVKDFKGEPYERSMAFYYRGLLYLRKGDFQNARAMFLSAERHDTMSEKEEYQADFGLMNYLAGWASYCDGSPARGRELVQRARANRPELFRDLPEDPNFLGIIESGKGPSKGRSGKHGELLTFEPDESSYTVRITNVEGADLAVREPYKAGDINYQATTRGGRGVQSILNGKAHFKDTTAAVGDAALTTGTATMMAGAYSNDSDMMNLGALMGLVGMLSNAASSATTPEADTRQWIGLPSAVLLMPGTLDSEADPPSLTLSYADSQGNTGQVQTSFGAVNGRCGMAWGRTHSAYVDKQLPNPVTQETKRKERNAAFRSDLVSMFGAGGLMPDAKAVAALTSEEGS